MKDLLPKLTQDELIDKIRENPENSPLVRGWGNLGPIYGVQWRHWKAPDGRDNQLDWAEWKTREYPKENMFLLVLGILLLHMKWLILEKKCLYLLAILYFSYMLRMVN